jgi:hypothetical protein
MKKALIIALLFLLPLQAMAVVQRSLAHLIGQNGANSSLVVKHVSEHASYTPHHHDDDAPGASGGDAHADSSAKSVKHLVDIEHGGGMQVLMPAVADFSIAFAPRIAPAFRLKSFTGRTTIPPLRPPRTRA